ncbi:hypothetical protein THAOC_00651, partial [Thalassiosira oceanica]
MDVDPVPIMGDEGRGAEEDPRTEAEGDENGTGRNDGPGTAAMDAGEGGEAAEEERGKTKEDGTNTTDDTSGSDDDGEEEKDAAGANSAAGDGENDGGRGDAASDEDDDDEEDEEEDDEDRPSSSGEEIKEEIKKPRAEENGDGAEGGKSDAENGKSDGGGDKPARNGGEADGKTEGDGEGGGLKLSSTDPAPSAPPAAAAPIVYPLLTGTLAYAVRDSVRRSVMRGNWRYENSHAAPPQAFELARTLDADEPFPAPGAAPAGGTYAGSFGVQHAVKTSKGKLKMRSRTVPETGVRLDFERRGTKARTREEGDSDDESDDGGGRDVYDVRGKGTNEFGVFELFGTATEEKDGGEEEGRRGGRPVVPRRASEAVPSALPPAPPGGIRLGGRRRRRREEEEGQEEEKSRRPRRRRVGGRPSPPHVARRGGRVPLRPARASHVRGAEPRPRGGPPHHRPVGHGRPRQDRGRPRELREVRVRAQVLGELQLVLPPQRTVPRSLLRERPRDQDEDRREGRDVPVPEEQRGVPQRGGRGSNFFGRYTITGTLTEDGVFTVFRHFQVPKLKVGKKKPAAAAGAGVGGGRGEGRGTAARPANGAAAAPPRP